MAEFGARGTRAGVAYERMRERILENRWPAGHSVLERELTDWLEMSRTPVREAMVRLQDEGLIEIVPRHGLRVLPLSAVTMRELYQVLCALEVAAAESVAVDPGRHAGLAGLERCTDDMDAALDADDRVAWARADERFHTGLVAMCGNRMLIETVGRYRDLARRARMMTLSLRPLPRASTREHRALVAALAAGETSLAAELHRAHRVRGAAELVPILQSLENNPMSGETIREHP